MHPDFSGAKIEKKVRKLREQICYYSFFNDTYDLLRINSFCQPAEQRVR